MKKLTVAIIGLEHVHAASMFAAFNKFPDKFEIIGCADVPPILDDVVEDINTRLKRNLHNGLANGITVYDDYKKLVELKPDIAVVCCNMRSYPIMVEELLNKNINTVIEKPMAMTFEDGIRMYKAYKNSNAFFAINWPVAWFDSFAKVKELVDNGVVGNVLRVQYRSPATFGPYHHSNESMSDEEIAKMSKSFWYNHSMGGGAALDYGGYGCTLATWLFGKQAERASGIRKNFFLDFSDVEDYVSYTLDFGTGVGLVEGSWSTMNNGEIPTGPVVYGTKGVLVSDRYGDEIKLYDVFSHKSTSPTKVFVSESWDKPTYSLGQNLYDHIVNGKPLYEMITPEFNIKALAALDAGIRSSYSGKWEDTKKLEDF